jgi:pimeloyl-ACP methyl ester carboxylesterase
VRAPTLVINGHADIAQDFVCQPFFKNIKKVKWISFASSSHTPMWEERERYMNVVGEFLGL